MFLIGIDYDDVHQDSYKGVELRLPDNTVERFETGNPTEDQRSAFRRYASIMREHGADLDNFGAFLHRSSWDHFVMDGDRWEYRVDPVLAEEGIHVETLAELPHA